MSLILESELFTNFYFKQRQEIVGISLRFHVIWVGPCFFYYGMSQPDIGFEGTLHIQLSMHTLIKNFNTLLKQYFGNVTSHWYMCIYMIGCAKKIHLLRLWVKMNLFTNKIMWRSWLGINNILEQFTSISRAYRALSSTTRRRFHSAVSRMFCYLNNKVACLDLKELRSQRYQPIKNSKLIGLFTAKNGFQ